MRLNILCLAAVLMSATHSSAQIVDGRDFSIDGFAAYEGDAGTSFFLTGGTTGGAGGKIVLADNFSELQAYLQAEQPYIVIVTHDITTGITAYVDDLNAGHLCDKQDGSEGVATTYGERILIAPNKTLIGVADEEGNAPLFSRITFVMQTVNNIIIRNCRFTMVGVPILKSGENKIVAYRDGKQVEVGDPDCIGIQADKESVKDPWGGHIWVDHCEFSNGDADNKDRYDGLLDCKNNVKWVTISYNHFHNHDKSCLFGPGNSDNYDRTISFHHNFFENIEGSRLPMQRYGFLHYYNNYMLGCSDGYAPRKNAVGCVEACYFENTKAPILIDKSEYTGLNINTTEDYGIIYKGCKRLIKGYSNIDGTKTDKEYTLITSTWKPTDAAESYTVNYMDKTADVPAICTKYSGAGKIEIWQSYTDELPTSSDATEFKKAIANPSTGSSYDSDGNKISANGGQTTAAKITNSQSSITRSEIYDLSGKRVAATDAKGAYIRRDILTDGTIRSTKFIAK